MWWRVVRGTQCSCCWRESGHSAKGRNNNLVWRNLFPGGALIVWLPRGQCWGTRYQNSRNSRPLALEWMFLTCREVQCSSKYKSTLSCWHPSFSPGSSFEEAMEFLGRRLKCPGPKNQEVAISLGTQWWPWMSLPAPYPWYVAHAQCCLLTTWTRKRK